MAAISNKLNAHIIAGAGKSSKICLIREFPVRNLYRKTLTGYSPGLLRPAGFVMDPDRANVLVSNRLCGIS
jgi:hypothetical protein